MVSKLVKCLDKDQDGVRASSFQVFKDLKFPRRGGGVKLSNIQVSKDSKLGWEAS